MTVWQETIARRLREFHLDSIRNQMLVFAVVATILPALVLTVASSRQDRRSIVDQIAQELRGTSAEAAWEIDQWQGDRLRDLRVAATAYAVAENVVRAQANGEAVVRLREYLNSVRERCSDCEALLVVEGHGRFVASSGGRMTGVQFSQDRLLSLRTSDALVGDPYWDAGLGKAAIGLAVSIRQPDGRYVGALMAKLNLRAVADVLQRLAPRGQVGGGGSGGGGGGDAYVMTEQGRLILRSRVSSADLMRTKLPTAQELFDREGSAVEYKRADGPDVIASLRRVPALRWAAVVEVPRAEAFRQAGGGGGAGLALVVLLVVAGLAAYVGVLLVRPLGRLSSVAAKVAGGDYSVEFPTGGGGEVGQLTQVFKNLVTRVREREGQGELERLSVTDGLTGLYNRRHLMGTLANEVQRSRRLRRAFSVLLADVDHFKQYNDTHGHLGGDAVLVKIAEILRQTTRGVDSVARYGGEEFLVMLIEAPIATAAAVGERLRARVAGEEFGGGRVTVSVGAAEYPTHGETPEELIASADAAMYQAKGEGRNRVVVAGRRAEPEKEGKKRRKGEG